MVDLARKHNLTKESQEVMGLIVASDVSSRSLSKIVCIPAPHSGQLNITTSTLFTPMKPGVSLKSKVMSGIEEVVVCSVSS